MPQAISTALVSREKPCYSSNRGLKSITMMVGCSLHGSAKNVAQWYGGHCNNHSSHDISLHLGDCNLGGNVSSSLVNLKHLKHLDLSYKCFIGSLTNLEYLNLSNNNFDQLQYLSMRNNCFNGELQIPLLNWTYLLVLDLGYNSFTGHIPLGIGSFLNATQILSLSLRSNNISGKFPISLCQLSNLQILDLSYNQISGILPECICHLQGMTNSMHGLDTTFVYGGQSKPVDVCNISEMLMWKRKEQSFENTLGMVKYIAISDNRLQGQIPSGISNLTGLESLDLGRNNFTGSIPSKIGELKSLEFLDLSSNHLSGQIPSTLANLNFLGTLNVSYNNLSGIIPTGTQLQSQDPSAYMGNPGLCGPPLSECSRGPPSMPPKGNDITREEDNDDSSDIFPGLYISVVLGFIVGFWGVCGSLVIKMSWR